MSKAIPTCAALLLGVGVCLISCGSGDVPPLTPDDPAFGVAGNALISDSGHSTDGHSDEIWIGFNSTSNWQTFQALRQVHPDGGFWIGGKVVPAPRRPEGFFFDPDTTVAAEVSVDTSTTVLDAIKADATKFASDPSVKVWMIPAEVVKISTTSQLAPFSGFQ